MSRPVVKYKLYGEIKKILGVTEHRRRFTILTILSEGRYTTTVPVGDNFMRAHKPQVGQYLVKQVDDSIVVLTAEEFQNAVHMEETVPAT